jgi:hypothetical protein
MLDQRSGDSHALWPPKGSRVSGERRASAGSKARVRCMRMLGGHLVRHNHLLNFELHPEPHRTVFTRREIEGCREGLVSDR